MPEPEVAPVPEVSAPATEEAPVTGNVVQVDAVQPTISQANALKKIARSRTGTQALGGVGITGLFVYATSFVSTRVDLAPLDPESTTMPLEVAISMVGLIVYLFGHRMNRPEQEPDEDAVP